MKHFETDDLLCALATLRLCVEIIPLKPKTFLLIAGEANGDLVAAAI